MNRLYGLIAVVCLGYALFIALALSGRSTQPNSEPNKKPEPVSSKNGGLKPREGGRELLLALDTEPPTLDPISVADTTSDGVACKLYNRLIRLRLNPDKSWSYVDELAESHTVSPDGLIYEFKLRKGVRFHNGREVKASDAEYSFKRLLSPLSKRSELLNPLVKGSEKYCKECKPGETFHEDPGLGIRAIDEYTFRIELEKPFAPFSMHLCTISCAIVAREAAEDKNRIFSREPMGTGPFKLVEWAGNQHLILKRNDDYFGGKPKLEGIRFLIYKDRMLQLKKFMAGQLDACVFPTGHVESASAIAGPENVFETGTMRTNYVGIGMPNGDFTQKDDLQIMGRNKLLRQALNYALDREYLCTKVLEGRGKPAKGVLPPGVACYTERKGWVKDLDKAKALMSQAGYPGGKGLPPITMLYRNDEDTKQMVQVIAHDFEQIGFRIDLKAREWKAFLESVENKPQSMFMLGWVADYPDPDNFLYVLFNSKQWGSSGNHTWFSNKEVDELTEKARATQDMAERAKLYARAEDIILDESPWICTHHAVNKVLLRKEVKGIREQATPLDTGTEYPQVDFKDVDVE